MLASMFGLRWAGRQKLDNQGRIFLNFDPYCFKKILSFFMGKLIEHPGRPAPLPIIRPEAKAQFAALAEYLGIKEFMGIEQSHAADATAGADCSGNFCLDQALGMRLHWHPQGCMASVDGRQLERGVCFASPAMLRGTLQFIKCSIISRKSPGSHGDWLFLGITQLVAPQMDVEQNVTSFGWSLECGYSQGKPVPGPPSAPAFEEGDKLIIKVDMTQAVGVLSLRCLGKSEEYRIDIQTVCSSPFYLFFGAVNFDAVALNRRRAGLPSGPTHVQGVTVQVSATTPKDRRDFQ